MSEENVTAICFALLIGLPLAWALIPRKHRGRPVHPSTHEIWKFMPNNPPRRGDTVLVDDERCRVTYCRVTWDGLTWTLHKMRVKPANREEKGS